MSNEDKPQNQVFPRSLGHALKLQAQMQLEQTEDPIGDKPRGHFVVSRAVYRFSDEMLKKLTPEEIISECADIANFAMMIADNERTKANKE